MVGRRRARPEDRMDAVAHTLQDVLSAGHGILDTTRSDAVDAMLRTVTGSGCRLARDIFVGSERDGSTLSAVQGDFWFHTDGCFWPMPPRWIAIQLLHSEGRSEEH